MSGTRRETLKILGAIGATCAFPFPADELYGQRVHAKDEKPAAARTEAYDPVFFGAGEYELVSRVADLIIPATDTPGALGAGVPEYVDRVVSLNPEHQGLMRAGLAWMDVRSRELFAGRFLDASDAQQIQMLQPLSDEVDRQQRAQVTARYRVGGGGGMTASDVMITELVRVRPTAPVEEIAKIMRNQRIHRVLVVDAGELLGILSTYDLIAVLEARAPAPARPVM